MFTVHRRFGHRTRPTCWCTSSRFVSVCLTPLHCRSFETLIKMRLLYISIWQASTAPAHP